MESVSPYVRLIQEMSAFRREVTDRTLAIEGTLRNMLRPPAIRQLHADALHTRATRPPMKPSRTTPTAE